MVVLIDNSGGIQVSEEILKKNFSELKENIPIKISSHFGIYDFAKNLVMKELIKNENFWEDKFKKFSSQEKEIWAFETYSKDICLSFNGFDFSWENFKRLKFVFNLSDVFLFHFDFNDIQNKNQEWRFIVQFFFVLTLENFSNNEVTRKEFHFIVYDNYLEKKNQEIQEEIFEKISELWCLSKDYFAKKKKFSHLKLEEAFSFRFSLIGYKKAEEGKFLQGCEELRGNLNQSDFEESESKTTMKLSSSQTGFVEKVEKYWKNSEKLLFFPFLNREDGKINELINLYQTELLFNQLWQISTEVITNWTTLVNRGKIMDNFGTIVSGFLNGLVIRFEKSLPENLVKDKRATKKIQELSDMVRQHIISLFTRQILNLQTQALDKFKDSLLTIITDSKKDFEFEKKIVMEKINSWFQEKAEKLIVPEMKLTFQGAKKELQNVLIEFSEKFKESPVVKLNSMQKVEKKTSSTGLKQSGIVIGFGMTTAVRPSGFGNFQLVTSYSHGPHVFNFSLVNDRDVAEQEGQGKIKPIRVQPSLNFDIDL